MTLNCSASSASAVRRNGAFLVAILLTSATWLVGCTHDSTPTFVTANLPPADALRDRIDAMVDHTLNNRTLDTSTHNAWQVVHGILPYGKAFKIKKDGEMIPALDYLLGGGELKGWDLRPGEVGVMAVLQPGSKAAQGHPDQWIGYLSQGGQDGLHGLDPDDKLVVAGKDHKIGELLTEAEWNVYPGMEASWTVMALSAFRPVDYKWTAKDGQEWTFERLVGMDAGLPIVGDGASCGGTHRLYALTAAVNRYMKDTKTPEDKLTGGWKAANDVVRDCVHKAKAFQQPDGSFSTQFFARPGSSPDVDTTLHATGHTLEWLDVALTDQQLAEPWVTAAVNRLVQLLEDNKERELDCGALYHAARGLILYRDRRFGVRPPGASSPEVSAAAKQTAAQ